MALPSGSKLGPYEIQWPLGAGGMGEVYRARDTRLDRTVAVKILTPHLSESAEAKQRFDREARAISSLSHPHICHLYDIGQQDGTDYLVMEYLEGETLADRLRRGPLSIDEGLKIGVEICDGLDKAHRNGIVHRDLKPSNVMLTKNGAKLMDFGLAKSAPALVAAQIGGAPLTPSTPTASIASVISSPGAVTQVGAIVGTFQYMAPEVLQGSPADARSDLFSFGCMLYEMITARPAFKGKSQISVVAAILEQDPEPITSIQPSSPGSLQSVIRACLAKDPEQRIQSAYDLKLYLQLVADSASSPTQFKTGRRQVGLFAAAAISLLVLAVALVWWLAARTGRQVLPPLAELSIDLPPGMELSPLSGPAISPDGTTVAFVAKASDHASSLYLRHLDSTVLRRLDGTESASYPFWSPDSASIGFFASGQLKRVDVRSGAGQVVAEAPDGRGGAWNKDGVIIFAPRAVSILYRVSASGGTAQPLTELNGTQGHRWPSFLADGRHFVYTAQSAASPGGIFLSSLDQPRGRFLTNPILSAQVSNDYVLVPRGTSIVAAKLDVNAAKLAPETTVVAERVRVLADRNLAKFSVSGNGVLVYSVGDTSLWKLAWFDRAGRLLESVNVADLRGELDLSQNGQYLLTDYTGPDGNESVEVIDLKRTAPVARALKRAESPVWSPSNESVVLSEKNLVRKWIDGSEREEVLVKSDDIELFADDWSKNGRWLLYERVDKQTNFDLMVLDLQSKREPQTYLRTPANEAHARISPDGRWVAYVSDESGRPEVYVQSFPSVGGGKWQISTEGGDQPYWRGDGGELFFMAPDLTLMSVPIALGKSVAPGLPVKLFTTRSVVSGITGLRNSYVASPDGKRFLMQYIPEQAGGSSINVVLNWQEKLKEDTPPSTR